jgi:hypothetical protein
VTRRGGNGSGGPPRRAAALVAPFRPRRAGGTTEPDLIAAARSVVAKRPGWAVVAAARTTRRGKASFELLTPSAGPGGRPRWRLVRATDGRLDVINVAAGEPIGRFASGRDALAAVGAIEARAAAAPRAAADGVVGGLR